MARKKSSSPAKPSPKNVVAEARAGGARRGSRGWILDHVKSLGGALLIYLVIKTFLLEAYRIPSGSMIPTLLVGDWLFVNKLVYGPKLPFMDVRLPGYAEPKRGEVVIFESPPQSDQPWDPTPTVVKRIVGQAGDTLHMRGGLLHVNGLPQRQGYAAATNASDSLTGRQTNPLFAWQRTAEVRGSRFGAPPAIPTLDDWGPIVVPPGHFFVMGDNRHESKDGRYWGFLPRANVRGRPMFVYYSFVPSSESDRPVSFITDIRWRRLGDWIR